MPSPASGRSSGREQLGQRRLGQEAGQQRGEGDAELRAGELEGQLAQRRADRARRRRSPASARRSISRPVDRDEGELGRDEERVARREQHEADQGQQRGQQQAVDDRLTSAKFSHGRRPRSRAEDLPGSPAPATVGCMAPLTLAHELALLGYDDAGVNQLGRPATTTTAWPAPCCWS